MEEFERPWTIQGNHGLHLRIKRFHPGPFTVTFSSVWPEEISRLKENAGLTLYHFSFSIPSQMVPEKKEFHALVTFASIPVLTSGTFSPQHKEVCFPARFSQEGLLYGLLLHIYFPGNRKHILQPMITHDYFTTSKFHSKKKCSEGCRAQNPRGMGLNVWRRTRKTEETRTHLF